MALLLLIAMPSAAKKYDFEFDVNAIGECDFAGKQFRVEPLFADTKRDDKAFLEFAKPVISYFKLCGADWAEEVDSIDFVIQIGWGVNLSEDRVEYTPRYVTDSWSHSYMDFWGNIWDVTTYDDRLVGYDVERFKEWTKYVKVKTIDYTSPKHDRVLWEMLVTTIDTKNATLGEAFYYMLFGACEFIGTSTGGTKSWKMSSRLAESDLMYEWVRSGTLCYSDVSIYPECSTTNYCDGKGVDLYAVERLNDRLVVTFNYTGKGTVVMPKGLMLAYTNAKGEDCVLQPTYVKGIELGKPTKSYLFQVAFPAIPKDVHKIDLFDAEAQQGDKRIVEYDDVMIK